MGLKRHGSIALLLLLASAGAAPTGAAEKLSVKGCYGKDGSPSSFARIREAGFNAVDRPAFREALDALPPDMKGIVWLGQYRDDCSWEKSDDWIRSHVAAIAGHRAILAYMLADEPHTWDCPSAPAQVRARSALVKSIDPGPPTVVVIEPKTKAQNPYTPYVGSVDIIAADPYPCSHTGGCDMSKIDKQIALLEEANVPRYWVLVQAFADSYYRLPTVAELNDEFRHWRRSRMEGYLVFQWAYKGTTLEDHPDLVEALKQENAK